MKNDDNLTGLAWLVPLTILAMAIIANALS